VRSSTCSEGSENGSAPEAAALVRERADRGPLVLGLASGRVSARCPENLARRAFPGKRRHAPDRDFQGTKDGRRSRCALVLGASRLRLMRSLRSHLFPGRFAPKASPKMRSLRSREPGTFVALRGASWRRSTRALAGLEKWKTRDFLFWGLLRARSARLFVLLRIFPVAYNCARCATFLSLKEYLAHPNPLAGQAVC
jgi:hypothetical protein